MGSTFITQEGLQDFHGVQLQLTEAGPTQVRRCPRCLRMFCEDHCFDPLTKSEVSLRVARSQRASRELLTQRLCHSPVVCAVVSASAKEAQSSGAYNDAVGDSID